MTSLSNCRVITQKRNCEWWGVHQFSGGECQGGVLGIPFIYILAKLGLGYFKGQPLGTSTLSYRMDISIISGNKNFSVIKIIL